MLKMMLLCGVLICGGWGYAGKPDASELTRSHATTLHATFAKGNQWEAITAEDLQEYVLPLTSLGETEVDWLPVLQPLAKEFSATAKTPLEAAMLINRHIWKRIGVIYSTKREKANQDPLHSIRLGLASCSGLSIILTDACRSIGIPARITGCVWKLKPGNHSWVEVKSGGKWYPLGAFEDVPPEKLWFLPDAAAADATDPRYAVYATRATPGNTWFYGWNVPADNVTERYVKSQADNAECRIFYAVEQKGERVAETFEVNGVTYRSPGPLQDLNDYAEIRLPAPGPFEVILKGKTYRYEGKPNQIIVEQLP